VCVLQRNCDLLPKLCRLQRINIHCRNRVVYNEIVIRCRSCVVCSDLAFTAELCVLQWNCDSLPKLCRPQWIGIHCRMACSAANLWFAFKTECLQRINIRCWIVCFAATLWFTAEIIGCGEC